MFKVCYTDYREESRWSKRKSDEWKNGYSDNRGFHLTFDNHVTVSVQWGAGNYCSNKRYMFPEHREEHIPDDSMTAEVAVWVNTASEWKDQFITHKALYRIKEITKKEMNDIDSGRHDVGSHLNADKVGAIIDWARKYKLTDKEKELM